MTENSHSAANYADATFDLITGCSPLTHTSNCTEKNRAALFPLSVSTVAGTRFNLSAAAAE